MTNIGQNNRVEVDTPNRVRKLLDRTRDGTPEEKPDAKELADELQYVMNLIGNPPPGSHPHEWVPRDRTWHQERLNALAEIERLRTECARLMAR
jgi:hypothetical protein